MLSSVPAEKACALIVTANEKVLLAVLQVNDDSLRQGTNIKCNAILLWQNVSVPPAHNRSVANNSAHAHDPFPRRTIWPTKRNWNNSSLGNFVQCRRKLLHQQGSIAKRCGSNWDNQHYLDWFGWSFLHSLDQHSLDQCRSCHLKPMEQRYRFHVLL